MKAMPWTLFSQELLAFYAVPMRAPNTRAKMRRMLATIGRMGVHSTAQLTPSLIARFTAERSHLAEATLRGYLAYLSPICDYAAEMGYVQVNPFKLRKPSKWVLAADPTDDQEDADKRFLTRVEIATLLRTARMDAKNWAGGRLYALVALLAYTGLRRNEALERKVEDFDLDAATVRIRRRRGRRLKTKSSSATLPLAPELLPVLGQWLPRAGGEWAFPNLKRLGPWTGGDVRSRPLGAIKGLGDRAGIEGVTFMAFRRSIATHAGYFNLSELDVKQLLRHTNLKTQEHYRKEALENLASKVSAITYADAS